MLVQVLLNPLRLAEQERRMLVGAFDEFLEHLHCVAKFFGELGVFLILPGVAEGSEARLQERHPILRFNVEAFEFFGEAADFTWIHDGLWHGIAPVDLFPGQNLTEARAGFQWEFRFWTQFKVHLEIKMPRERLKGD
jgi:hypothetical protein